MALSKSVQLTLLLGLGAVLLLSPPYAKAEELDSASQDALEKTQNVLTNHAARKNAVNESAETKRANDDLEKLAGSQENTDAMYGLSSDIFAKLVKDSNGNSAEMQHQLELAAKDPGAFINSLTPAQRQSLEAIARGVASKQPAAAGSSSNP